MKRIIAILVVLVVASSLNINVIGQSTDEKIIVETTQITNDAATQKYPEIYGNLITWQDSRNSDEHFTSIDMIAYQNVHSTGCSPPYLR